MVIWLQKALYRLKQVLKSLYDNIELFFLSFGFQQWYPPDILMCLAILYVDDLLVTASFEVKIEQLLMI